MTHKKCLNPCSNGRYSRSVSRKRHQGSFQVLILVLMEDTLGALCLCVRRKDRKSVLILVLMEDTLGDIGTAEKGKEVSLNPCSNGRYSRRLENNPNYTKRICLNPCSNGRYSRRSAKTQTLKTSTSLNPCSNGRYSRRCKHTFLNPLMPVLILVLMEDTLGDVSGVRL